MTWILLFAPHVEAEPEACFPKAIDIARERQAKSLELRAATSLARLWQQQGKKAEAQRRKEGRHIQKEEEKHEEEVEAVEARCVRV